MSWLIKTADNTLEIWTDQEHALMLEKCEYYGAKPHWQEVRRLEGGTNNFVPPSEIQSHRPFLLLPPTSYHHFISTNS